MYIFKIYCHSFVRVVLSCHVTIIAQFLLHSSNDHTTIYSDSFTKLLLIGDNFTASPNWYWLRLSLIHSTMSRSYLQCQSHVFNVMVVFSMSWSCTQGPLKQFAQSLGRMQKKFLANKHIVKESPIRIYIVTSRSAASSGERAIKVRQFPIASNSYSCHHFSLSHVTRL